MFYKNGNVKASDHSDEVYVRYARRDANMVNEQLDNNSEAPHSSKNVRTFRFPIKKHVHLLPRWERFVNRGASWSASQNTVLCERHFDPKFIKVSKQRAHLDWKSDPVPTLYNNETYSKYPSLLPTERSSRKPPTKRNYQDDELPKYREMDPVIHNVFELESHCPKEFTCRRVDQSLLSYSLEIDTKTQFPKVILP